MRAVSGTARDVTHILGRGPPGTQQGRDVLPQTGLAGKIRRKVLCFTEVHSWRADPQGGELRGPVDFSPSPGVSLVYFLISST